MPDKKINPNTKTGRINIMALEIIERQPDGVRWTELQNEIKRRDPSLHPKTVNGCVWLLAKNFPDTIYKPEKGLFRATRYRN